ncbi:MAG: sodium:solute symporter family transporter [Terriglobia bacterium]
MSLSLWIVSSSELRKAKELRAGDLTSRQKLPKAIEKLMKTLQTPDYVIIAGYFAIMVALGIYCLPYARHVRNYFTGNNQVPWWLAGISFYRTSFSAFIFVGFSEIAYRYGFVAVTLFWMPIGACLVAATVFAPRWRRARVLSPIEYIGRRYHPALRQVFAWGGIPLRMVDDGLRIYATAIFISVGMGFNLKVSILACGAVVLLYTLLGGLWAVMVTDFVQFIILAVAVVVFIPFALARVGGLKGFVAGAPPGYFALTSAPYTWPYVISYLVLLILNYNAGWSLAQRYYCVRDEREARKVALSVAVLQVISPPIFFLPAMVARQVLPELLVAPNKPEYCYAALAMRVLPTGFVGLMVAAMFSATMSALSAEYNVLSAVLTNDIYYGLLNRKADQRRLILVARLTTLLVGVLTIGLGFLVLLLPGTTLFSKMVTVYGVLAPALMIPLLAGFLSRRISWRGALAGLVAGLTSGISFYAYRLFFFPGATPAGKQWVTQVYEPLMIFIDCGVTILAMVITTLLERRTAAEEQQAKSFFERLDRPVLLDAPATADEPALAPFHLVGVVVMLVGALLAAVGFFTASDLAHRLNVGVGLAIVVLGYVLYRAHREPVVAVDAVSVGATGSPGRWS